MPAWTSMGTHIHTCSHHTPSILFPFPPLVLGLLGCWHVSCCCCCLICGVVHTRHCAARGVLLAGPCRVPQCCCGCRAGDTGPAWHGVRCRLLGEVLLKDGAVPVALLGFGGVVRVPVVGLPQLLIADNGIGVRFEPVNPVVADTVRELLLLPPQHLSGQVGVLGGVKRLAQDILLNAALALVNHLLRGVNAHGHIQEGLVQEGHTRLHTPRHGRLVGPQAVVLEQVLQLAHSLGLELLLVWRLVEV
mmetsp:Transcript_25705/g.56004  ORF Transcript_25705/g.56004 Transcript_25705/m.56004 type:complete len:247 (-) Transcript_25705:1183-1923(-)